MDLLRGARAAAVALIAVVALAVPAGALAGSAPVVVGSTSNTTSLAGDIGVAVAGSYAYTTAYWPGQLTVVDISNPTAPTVVGTTPPTTSLENGSALTVSGHYAFVVSKNRNASTSSNDDGTGNSLTIVDISNPASPTVVGSISSPTALFGAYGVAVQGSYAYVAYQGVLAGQPQTPDTSTGGFSVIDITNPAGPKIVATIDNGSLTGSLSNGLYHATAVAISSHYAYVTAWAGGHLTVIDISNPTAPQIVYSLADWPHLQYSNDITIQGNYAYIAAQTGSTNFQLVDVSLLNPARPVIVGALSNSTLLTGAYRVRVRGNYAYVAATSRSTVAAIDVSNPATPRIAGYLTDAAHLHSVDDVDIDSSGRYVIANSPQASGQTNPLYPPFPGQAGGGTITGALSVIDMIPNPIAVPITPASEPANPTTQTSANFSFAASDDVSSTQCSLDGAAYAPCTSQTSQTYANLTPGNHTFTVQATDAVGNTSTSTYTWLVGTAPSAGSPGPAISGTPAPGQTLTASSGTWSGSPAPTYQYQWSRCDQNGQNCTAFGSPSASNTYAVQQSDLGSTFTVTVTGTNALGSAQATSTATGPVSAAPQAGSPGPAVSGTPAPGQTLTASAGTWTGYPPPSFTYQWNRCDQNGQNCTPFGTASPTNTYTLQQSDAGSTFTVTVTATNSIGSAQATSAATSVVTSPASPPVNSGAPSISPTTPTVGQQLTADPGTWSGTAPITYTYQWNRCDQSGQNCTGIASGQTYTAQPADAGSTLEVAVSASNSAGSSANPVNSSPTQAVTEAPTGGTPTISGTTTQGKVLTAAPGTWAAYPAPTYTYQWNRCDQNAQNCSVIAGQTGAAYTLQRADVGNTVTAQVTASNGVGSAGTATSAATARIWGPPLNTSLPTVSGTDVQGSVLTATPGTWTGYPSFGFTYTWQRCPASGEGCTMLTTAHATTYTLTAADVGYSMRIYIQAQGAGGYAVARSAGTPIVQSNTSGAVIGAFTVNPTLHLQSTAARTISSVTVALGSGASFTARVAAIAKATKVTDAAGHRLAFQLKLVHHRLVITLAHGVRRVKVAFGRGAFVVAHATLARSQPKGGLTATVVLAESGHRTLRDHVKLPLR
jgi:hypothetical protein